MKLSERDQRHFDALKRIEKSFYHWRYLNLAMGVIALLLAFGGLMFFSFTSSETAARFGSHPMFYLLAVAGGAGIGYAIRGWKGDPGHRLLITVIEELTRRESTKA